MLVTLTASERHRLKQMAYGHKTEYRLRMRARVVLHAARRRSNARGMGDIPEGRSLADWWAYGGTAAFSPPRVLSRPS
ncbi:hypothetical protein E1267_06550 [Nonomuraea longispora]|uniref:Uncharacterized protein n=1 Tax=Nonomuraea longispora TaxID=1848320 RepID=A0A4R4NKK5_9ACTN|nr:hypothetical protein [Nonomuraea longispora]TDC09689.1 hypothetical protein E1267_06550 [Nonomuraea longispora]